MQPRCLLIIDDESDIWEMTQITLETIAGWQVLGACSGQEGIEMAIAQQPHAILLDVMMPDMDGLTTCQHLRTHASTQQIPIILLTATEDTDRGRFAALGIEGVISKPFDPVTLAQEISTILQWS
jgi:CheY-like chemotaxis protein